MKRILSIFYCKKIFFKAVGSLQLPTQNDEKSMTFYHSDCINSLFFLNWKTILMIFFLPNTLIIKALAQKEKIVYIEDKYSWNVSLSLGNPVGKYNTILKDANKAGTKGGLVLGGLMNPYKRKRASPVFYGAEIGFQSDGRDEVDLKAQGDFFVSNNSYWLNGVARYRPILWSSKLNPYADAFFGAKLIKSNIIRQATVDQSEIFDKFHKIVPNYGVGFGVGMKLTGQLKNNYLDIGLYYQQADATKIMKRNSVNINSAYIVSYKQVVTATNQIVIKIGLTGFL